MTPLTLPVKQNRVTLPEEWVRNFGVEEVAAVTLGDVVIIRPLREVAYSPAAEAQVLEAIAAFDESERQGSNQALGTKKFSELQQAAEQIS